MTPEPLSPAGAAPVLLVRERVRHTLAVRHLTVARTERLSTHLLRVTLSGDALDGFVSDGPTDHVKLFVPDPATGVLHAPSVGLEGMVRPDQPPLVRDYTPRAVRPGELDLDFVLHGTPGPVSGWAASAKEGDAVAIAGPRGSHLVPRAADHLLLGGDESALPAIARWLEMTPGVPADVLVELTHRDDEAYLADVLRPEHEVRYLYRGDVAPGRSTVLADAARTLPVRGGTGYAWFGGEAGSLVPVRRWLRQESGFTRGNFAVSGYWKLGEVAFDHHAPIDPEDPES